MLPERLVSIAVAAIIAFAVGGGKGSSPVAYPTTTPVVTDTATPAPPVRTAVPIGSTLSADTHDTETLRDIPLPNVPEGLTYEPLPEVTTTTLYEIIEGAVEPRYDLPKPAGIENALCPDWWQLAMEVGWTEEQLPTLDRVMWAETRCIPDLISRSNDYGLVQINRAVWRETVEENGWTMDDLLIPRNALAMGLIVYEEAEAMGWCGWQPWFMSGDYCR